MFFFLKKYDDESDIYNVFTCFKSRSVEQESESMSTNWLYGSVCPLPLPFLFLPLSLSLSLLSSLRRRVELRWPQLATAGLFLSFLRPLSLSSSFFLPPSIFTSIPNRAPEPHPQAADMVQHVVNHLIQSGLANHVSDIHVSSITKMFEL